MSSHNDVSHGRAQKLSRWAALRLPTNLTIDTERIIVVYAIGQSYAHNSEL